MHQVQCYLCDRWIYHFQARLAMFLENFIRGGRFQQRRVPQPLCQTCYAANMTYHVTEGDSV